MSNHDDEFFQQAQAKDRAQISASKWAGWLKLLVWAVGGIITITAGIVAWAFLLRADLNNEIRERGRLEQYAKDERARLDKELTEVKGHSETNRVAIEKTDKSIELKAETDKRVYDSLKTLIEANTTELRKREPLIGKVDEMWFMKEHGISNKEDFSQRHPGVTIPNNEPKSK